jgi:ABC-2 type transport system ATP-binding protein
VQRQLIGTLSKGYRQRVGLADALLADPPVLILDEPTAGLDPTQIRSTRKLIRELGQQHTILLSTHILSEVELVCDSVIIIHRGQVAAAGPLKDLTRRAGDVELLAANFEGTIDAGAVRALPGVMDLGLEEKAGATHLRITTSDAEALSPHLFRLAVERDWKLKELRPQRQTLEDMFVRITDEHGTFQFVPAAGPPDERVVASERGPGVDGMSAAHRDSFTQKD